MIDDDGETAETTKNAAANRRGAKENCGERLERPDDSSLDPPTSVNYHWIIRSLYASLAHSTRDSRGSDCIRVQQVPLCAEETHCAS